MKQCEKMRLATAPHRPMTTNERRFHGDHMINLYDLPVVHAVPTRDGGTLEFSLQKGAITLVNREVGRWHFGMEFPVEDFLSMLSGSRCLRCPNVGVLVIDPLPDRWVRMRLVPEAHVTGPWGRLSFTSEFSLDEMEASLYPG